MEEQKVYLFVETPFSLKKPLTRRMFLMYLGLLPAWAFCAVVMYRTDPGRLPIVLMAMLFSVVLGGFFTAIYLRSYVTVEDKYLACKYGGLLPKRILISNRLRWKTVGGQLRVLSGDAVLLQMPDSDAAKRLMSAARIPADQ